MATYKELVTKSITFHMSFTYSSRPTSHSCFTSDQIRPDTHARMNLRNASNSKRERYTQLTSYRYPPIFKQIGRPRGNIARIVALETREEISSSLEDIYFPEKRFSRKREREREKVLFRSRNSLDFNWKQNVVEWIPVALGKRFLGKITCRLPFSFFQPFYPRRGRFKNILLPFDDGRRSSPFRRRWLLLHHVSAHPISNHALYPLTGQNQHDCG